MICCVCTNLHFQEGFTELQRVNERGWQRFPQHELLLPRHVKKEAVLPTGAARERHNHHRERIFLRVCGLPPRAPGSALATAVGVQKRLEGFGLPPAASKRDRRRGFATANRRTACAKPNHPQSNNFVHLAYG